MDNFREWLSDNLRYILLGLAIILILTIAILAVRFIGAGLGGNTNGGNSGSGTGTEAQTSGNDTERQSESSGSAQTGNTGSGTASGETEGSSETGTAGETEGSTEEPLAENDPDVLSFVQTYYTAIQNKDLDTYSTLVDEVTDEARETLEGDSIVESYNNIRVYTKSGLTEGSYVAYMCYDAKVTGVEDLAPGMSTCYISTREDGSLYMVDPDSDSQIAAYMQEVLADSDVQALILEVKNSYNEVLNSNEALRSLMNDVATPETEIVYPSADSTGVEVNQVVQATAVVNVRADSTTEADILGMLDVGATVTRIRVLDNGWSEIRYGDSIGYVSSQYLTEDVGSADGTAQ